MDMRPAHPHVFCLGYRASKIRPIWLSQVRYFLVSFFNFISCTHWLTGYTFATPQLFEQYYCWIFDWDIFTTLSNIYDGTLLKIVSDFCKKLVMGVVGSVFSLLLHLLKCYYFFMVVKISLIGSYYHLQLVVYLAEMHKCITCQSHFQRIDL